MALQRQTNKTLCYLDVVLPMEWSLAGRICDQNPLSPSTLAQSPTPSLKTLKWIFWNIRVKCKWFCLFCSFGANTQNTINYHLNKQRECYSPRNRDHTIISLEGIYAMACSVVCNIKAESNWNTHLWLPRKDTSVWLCGIHRQALVGKQRQGNNSFYLLWSSSYTHHTKSNWQWLSWLQLSEKRVETDRG